MATVPTPSGGSRNPLARRWLLNLALLAVVVALALFAWLRADKKPEDAQAKLTDIAVPSIKNIEIARRGEPPVQLQRTDNTWRLVAPAKARADSFAVDNLLRVLQAPVEGTVTPTDGELARYGLDRPTLTLRFDETEIRFGEMHPLKNAHYVQHGATVQLIASRYFGQAATPYTSMIDSRLIEPGRKPIAFKLPDFALALTDGEWKRTPAIEALSSDRINAFVDDWRHARALQVKPHTGPKAQEQITVTVENPDGGRSEFVVGVLARAPELVLHRADEGLEYHFPEDTGRRLLTLDAEPPK